MPRDTYAFSSNSFVAVGIQDIQRLQQHKASGMTMRVWLVLKQHCFNFQEGNRHCFPSLERIASMLGYEGKNFNSAIGKCLRWLEQHQFIKRQQARKKHDANTERFELLDDTTSNDVKAITSNDVHKKNNREKNNLPSFNPSQTGKENTSKRKRMSKFEKRQRRWERKRQKAQEELLQHQQSEELKSKQAADEWNDELPKAQKEIEAMNLGTCHHEKVSLALARFHYEQFPNQWEYIVPPISELGLEDVSWALNPYDKTTRNNKYYYVFCTPSEKMFREWIRSAYHSSIPRG